MTIKWGRRGMRAWAVVLSAISATTLAGGAAAGAGPADDPGNAALAELAQWRVPVLIHSVDGVGQRLAVSADGDGGDGGDEPDTRGWVLGIRSEIENGPATYRASQLWLLERTQWRDVYVIRNRYEDPSGKYPCLRPSVPERDAVAVVRPCAADDRTAAWRFTYDAGRRAFEVSPADGPQYALGVRNPNAVASWTRLLSGDVPGAGNRWVVKEG